MQPSLASSSAWLDCIWLNIAGVSAGKLGWRQCSQTSLVSRAECDLHPVWIWGRVADLTMALMVVVEAGEAVHLLYRAGSKTPDGGC